MPTEDDGLENFEEEALDDEVEEEEQPEAQQETAPPLAAKNGAKRRKQRSDKGASHKPPGEGWSTREAELLWPEILQRMPRMQPPKSPYDVSIQIVRFSPSATPLPGSIEGAFVAGGKGSSPGDALRRAIEDYYHVPAGRGPEEYEVRFVWKTTGRIIGRGKLNMASSEEIVALRRASEDMKRRRPYAAAQSPYEAQEDYAPEPPPRRQAPQAPAPGHYPAMQPGGAFGFGAAQPQSNDEVGHLRQQVGYLSGQLQQLVSALSKSGGLPPQAAPAPAPGFGASPPPAPSAHDNLDERIVGLLQRLGVVKTGVGAAPAAAASPTSVASELHAGVSAFKAVVGLGKELRHLARELNDVYGDEVGPVEAPEPPLVAEPIVAPPKPGEALPFEVVEIPETNFLGHPAKYAIDKETGGFSREGFFMANPGLAEKALEIGGKLVETLGRMASSPRAGVGSAPQEQPAQVVQQIPHGAVDATPTPQEPEGSSNGGL